MQSSLYPQIYQAIMQTDVLQKCQSVARLYESWRGGALSRKDAGSVEPIDVPGRPDKPLLVDPRQVERRSIATDQGRKALLHSFAHIEFNAINLALDAAYRFRDMPDQFITDWLQVAAEEAYHFSLINDYLDELESPYGSFQAHNGLWDMVCKTRHDVLHRMALVPRVMEARGLDVTPSMMQRFEQIGDTRARDILSIIYQEEIGHVRIGNHWYQYCCSLRELDPEQTFQQLIEQYFEGRLRGPFNYPARIEAGFAEQELQNLEACL